MIRYEINNMSLLLACPWRKKVVTLCNCHFIKDFIVATTVNPIIYFLISAEKTTYNTLLFCYITSRISIFPILYCLTFSSVDLKGRGFGKWKQNSWRKEEITKNKNNIQWYPILFNYNGTGLDILWCNFTCWASKELRTQTISLR